MGDMLGLLFSPSYLVECVLVIAASLLGGRQNSSGVCPPRLLVSSHPYPYPSPVLYFILYAFLLEDPQATVFQYFSLRISYDTQGRYVGALVYLFFPRKPGKGLDANV
mmetsp:Transcript_15420/g.25192  ORF Transcript_15420/g.25192 Transcript_15420/m.25192 type:complete len:108 (-) Transcript_15420:766-1089(-)